jgi:hypothetical protein
MSEMSEHRVPMLGSSWRRNQDPALSRDPRVRAVVGALATLPAPRMGDDYRAELRAQLVAITPRIVTESAQTSPMVDIVPGPTARLRPTPQGARTRGTERAPARHSDSFLDRIRRIHLGRPLAVAAAVVAAFAVLLGGAVVMSKKSLPGDALYGLKRASENFELATAGSDTEKAGDYLDFARTRAQEVKDLLGRSSAAGAPGVPAAGGLSSGTQKLIRSTLGSADSDVEAASRLLATQAVRRSSATPLTALINWAPAQLNRLRTIATAMPSGSLHDRAVTSVLIVQAAQGRAAALKSEVGCGCLTNTGHDALGPVPCSPCDAPISIPNQPQQQGNQPPRTTPTTKGAAPGTSPVPGQATSSGPAAPQPTGSSGGSGSGSASSPGLHLPSVIPSISPSVPVDLNSCGASVSLPILGGIDLNLCKGVHVGIGG